MAAAPGIILQARFASQRLPGKALRQIAGRTILEQCLLRLRASGTRVVLATTARSDDDALARVAAQLDVPVFRGDDHDVLARFVRCAERFEIDPIVRATADNPAVDIAAPGRVLAALRDFGADYVSEGGLPLGTAVEGVTAAALLASSRRTQDLYDREHVTTFVRGRRDLFTVVDLPAPLRLAHPDLRMTVDTPDDLRHLCHVYDRCGGPMPSLEELIAAARTTARQEVA